MGTEIGKMGSDNPKVTEEVSLKIW